VINRATSSTVCESLCWSPPISVLEPLLFLIYINDIGEKLLSLSRLFADDTSQNKKQLNSFFSSELSIELYSSNSWWIVECFGRKPD
jgi:hypothetical protein